jgi:hypothetical protein
VSTIGSGIDGCVCVGAVSGSDAAAASSLPSRRRHRHRQCRDARDVCVIVVVDSASLRACRVQRGSSSLAVATRVCALSGCTWRRRRDDVVARRGRYCNGPK